MDLVELLERCRQGDELAWEVLVRQYQSKICAIAYTYVGSADEARDLAQDIFIRVYRRLDTCRDADRFQAWLVQIARNACLDHLRRIKARPPRQDIPAEEMYDLVAEQPDPEQQWLQGARKKMVFKALQTLSAINREIILLKDMQGLPLEEIARLLNVPIGTVKSRSNRARIELARAVQGLGGRPGAEAVS